MAPLLESPCSQAGPIRPGDSVWHCARALQGRGTPDCRRIVVWTLPTTALQQVLSRKKPSPSGYPDA